MTVTAEDASATATAQQQAPGLPDYMTDPNAVLADSTARWRYGKAPDYSNTRRVFAETKTCKHEPGSLPDLVQNLVKNWEIEASFKTDLRDWRTVDREKYTFAINGDAPQSAEHMLAVGTYNAIILHPNQWYSPRTTDLASSHKTFKRMMPTFAWEVLEVYSGPPVVAFKWRHWGVMKEDYVGWNDNGDKVTARAHGGLIDIEGVTVAHLGDEMKVSKLETWFDPVDMFRQISPAGVAKKEAVTTPAHQACPFAGNTGNSSASDKNASPDEPTIGPQSTTRGEEANVTLQRTNSTNSATKTSKAVVDVEDHLGTGETATQSDPIHGEIPRPNAE